MNLPPPGDYVAKTNGQIIIGEASTGALMADVPCVISQGEHAGFTCKALVCIATKDGALQTNAIDNLKAAFNWDGVDPFVLMFNDDNSPRQGFPELEFSLSQCIHEEYKDKTYFKVGWLNPLGGGMKRIEPADRRSVLAKYGSKFRALAGGAAKSSAPAAKPTAAKTPPAPAAKKPTLPPSNGPTATMEECWEELCKANDGKYQDELSELWFATIKSEFNTDNNSDVTPQQWGALKAKLTDDVPM